jgi:murein DD-endopeptidase MepM/ murein hydrolase activator NlpD
MRPLLSVNLSLMLACWLYVAGGTPLLAQPAPGTANFDPTKPPTQTRVGRGETLFTIAERTRSPLKALIAVNNLAPPYPLSPGQVLTLPPLKVHVVKTGETFSAIARRYRVDERSLSVFNRLSRPVTVGPGQRILLPPLVIDRFTGLEPQDLVDLLTSELKAGRKVTGAIPGQIVAPKTPPIPLPVTKPSKSVATGPSPSKTVPQPLIGPTDMPGPMVTNPLIWPIHGRIVETFGTKKDFRTLDGIEIEAPAGAPFRAAANGTVVYVGNQLVGYGWLILIRHENNVMSAYAYAQSVNVREGQRVTRGQVIGLVGTTGRATTPRLHFQVRENTHPVDPISRLPRVRSTT